MINITLQVFPVISKGFVHPAIISIVQKEPVEMQNLLAVKHPSLRLFNT